MNDETMEFEKGLRWRIPISIVSGVGWLIFLVLWLFFYWGEYSWERNLAVIMLSLLVVGIILVVPWMSYGMHQRWRKDKVWKVKGFKTRVITSTVVAFLIFIGLIVWFWFYATPYAWYQNLAILIVALLIGGGTMGASWAPWGMKHHRELEAIEDD